MKFLLFGLNKRKKKSALNATSEFHNIHDIFMYIMKFRFFVEVC